jgi:hypothetical protein
MPGGYRNHDGVTALTRNATGGRQFELHPRNCVASVLLTPELRAIRAVALMAPPFLDLRPMFRWRAGFEWTGSNVAAAFIGGFVAGLLCRSSVRCSA